MGSGKHFTKHEDKWLADWGEALGVEESAKFLKRSIEGTRGRFHYLGITPPPKNVWTRKLENDAVKYALIYNCREIAEKLDMPEMAVRRKLNELGVDTSHSEYQRKRAERAKFVDERIVYLSERLHHLYKVESALGQGRQ